MRHLGTGAVYSVAFIHRRRGIDRSVDLRGADAAEPGDASTGSRRCPVT